MAKRSKTVCWVRNVNGKICNKPGVVQVSEPIPGLSGCMTVEFYCEQHRRLAELKAAR